MSKINEILTAIILYSVTSYILSLPNLEYALIIAALASQINIILPKNYKHTLIHYIPLSILLIVNTNIIIPVIIGYTASIFINLLSKNGCKLIYPIRETTFTGPENYLENNTKQDYATTFFLITLVIITLLLSFNGTEIIEKLSDNNMETNTTNNYTQPVTHYININPANCNNKNITTTKTENTTTTIITDYEKT